jgi:hypothetical protein
VDRRAADRPDERPQSYFRDRDPPRGDGGGAPQRRVEEGTVVAASPEVRARIERSLETNRMKTAEDYMKEIPRDIERDVYGGVAWSGSWKARWPKCWASPPRCSCRRGPWASRSLCASMPTGGIRGPSCGTPSATSPTTRPMATDASTGCMGRLSASPRGCSPSMTWRRWPSGRRRSCSNFPARPRGPAPRLA